MKFVADRAHRRDTARREIVDKHPRGMRLQRIRVQWRTVRPVPDAEFAGV
jgi:hypothetical protein